MVAIKSTSLIAASIALLSSYVHAYGQIAQVVDANNFCVFLPPSDSVDRGIADTEWNAEAFCIGKAPLAKNAGKLESGFIQSAHYLATDKYVQVTGQINPAKARLNATDEGGQYDIKAPKGSSCAGWKFYVNLVEPAGNTYCMRCCNDDRSCNRGISEKGCAHIIPGDYSGPYDNGGAPREYGKPGGSHETANAKKTTTTKAKTTTTKKIKKTTTTAKATTTTISTRDSTATTTTTTADAVTTPINSADDANQVSETTAAAITTTSAADTNATPNIVANANATPAASNAIAADPSAANVSPAPKASTKNNEMLSQNDQVTEQSISGADQFEPTLMTFVAGIVTMVMMLAQ